MLTLVFVDLDDTLFQTRGKCPPGAELIVAALDRQGQPLSFMTRQQQQFLEWLDRSAHVIPVTARNSEALGRVHLPFRHGAILDFGAVIQRPDGTLDPVWDSQMRPALLELESALRAIERQWQAWNEELELGLRVRVVSDHGMPLYVVAKHPDSDLQRLGRLENVWRQTGVDSRFFVHANHNNLCAVPRCVGKEHAVTYFLRTSAGPEPQLVLGVGDSLSDIPFLALCDFAMLPRRSQILKTLLGIPESERHV